MTNSNVIELPRKPTTVGDYIIRFQGRVWRYKRLGDINAPTEVLNNEERLIEQAMEDLRPQDIVVAMLNFHVYMAANPWG